MRTEGFGGGIHAPRLPNSIIKRRRDCSGIRMYFDRIRDAMRSFRQVNGRIRVYGSGEMTSPNYGMVGSVCAVARIRDPLTATNVGSGRIRVCGGADLTTVT